MKLLITHLTRMKYPRVCVAGLDEAGRYVRPVPVVGTQEVLDLEVVRRGLFRLGNRIELGWHEFRDPPQPPAVEDCYFSNASLIDRASPEEFWSYLNRSAKTSLDTIFGYQLRPEKTSLGYTMVLPPGQGKASLGDLWVEKFDLSFEEYEGELKLRGIFAYDQLKLCVAVTDLRFYNWKEDKFQLNVEKVWEVRDKLEETQVILSLGFSREFKGKHWLQINGVHLKSDPLWE